MTGDARLPKSQRLRNSPQFRAVFHRKLSAADDHLVVYARENGEDDCRLGVAVSKKIGGAVVRNRWKRLFREAFRLTKHELPPGYDVVLIPRRGAEPNLEAFCRSLPKLMHKLHRRAGKANDASKAND